MTAKRRKIVLATPKGKRKASRVVVEVHMHPSTLAKLEERAASIPMSLTAYVDSLLDFDPNDDVVEVPTLALARQAQEHVEGLLKQHLRETNGPDGGEVASSEFWAKRALGAR